MVWKFDWLWGLPLIVGTLVFHVIVLGCLAEVGERALLNHPSPRDVVSLFATATGSAGLMATLLLAFDTLIWATAYRILGALPTSPQAMLYSLSAITSYGHADVLLEPKWQLMGALEAVNGALLFGITTAFLFAVLQRVWPHNRNPHKRVAPSAC